MNNDNEKGQNLRREFRLYDDAYWIVVVGLLFFTYDAFTDDVEWRVRIISTLNVTFWWVLVLFKIHTIGFRNGNTLIFKSFLRRITVNPKDIIAFQDALRGLRIVLKDKSIILWPFIERQGEFKTLLQSLNPDIKLVDVSHEATKSPVRQGLFFLGLIIFVGLSLAGWYYQIIHSHWW
jgi:hypothetical protein